MALRCFSLRHLRWSPKPSRDHRDLASTRVAAAEASPGRRITEGRVARRPSGAHAPSVMRLGFVPETHIGLFEAIRARVHVRSTVPQGWQLRADRLQRCTLKIGHDHALAVGGLCEHGAPRIANKGPSMRAVAAGQLAPLCGGDDERLVSIARARRSTSQWSRPVRSEMRLGL